MRFRVAPAIFAAYPTYCVGVVVARNLNNQPDAAIAEQIEAQLQATTADLHRRFATGEAAPGASNPVSAHPHIAAWREAFRLANIKPGEFLSSVEALARRAVKDGSIPAINPAVNISNNLSLTHLLPLGGHDLDTMTTDFEVRPAQPADKFYPTDHATSEDVPAGEPVYVSGGVVRTRRWVWRQGAIGRITTDSRNIIFPIDGFANLNQEQVRQATEQLRQQLEQRLGAQCRTYFVDASHPEIDLDQSEAATSASTSFNPPTVVPGVVRERDKIDALLTRGVADIVTREELEAKLRSGRQLRVKLGIDPTGPQIHIGRSVAIWKLRDFQDLGHQVVMLFGAFTAQIGDVSGHNATRPMLTPELVLANVATYKDQISKILNPALVEWRANTEWYNAMPFREGITLMSNFTVAQMLERDSFADRYQSGKPISLQELVYPVLQGYDSVMLKADVEMGGTDQLFNMMAGRVMQRIYGQPEQSILMNKMINGVDGQKMSTSLGNGLFITEPPRDIFAKMLKTVDEQITEYMEVLTRLPQEEVEEARTAIAGGANPVGFKKKLAYRLVEQYHGRAAAEEAAEGFERQFVQKELPEDIPTYSPPVGTSEMEIRDLLVEAKLASSKKEAERLIAQGGVSINGEKIENPKARVTLQNDMLIKRGARHYARLKL